MEQRRFTLTSVVILILLCFNFNCGSSSQRDYYPRIVQKFTEDMVLESELLPIVIENTTCETDEECRTLLPNLIYSLSTSSTVPSAPYCSQEAELQKATKPSSSHSKGHCTCGPGKCVSFTMEIGRSIPYYYCGPCSHVGAQCTNGTCAHEMAECKNAYCQCIKGGIFYDFNYCEIPYKVYENSLQVGIIVCIVIVLVLICSSIYSAIRIHPLCVSHRDHESTPEQSISEDMPPCYEEVVDNLPTYRDALDMLDAS